MTGTQNISDTTTNLPSTINIHLPTGSTADWTGSGITFNKVYDNN
jgi:hypothetical protein